MKLVNDLIALTSENYEQCLSTITRDLLSLPYCLSIYQFGQIGFPGISDIDLLIIIDNQNELSKKVSEIEKVLHEIPNGHYFFYHEPLIVSKEETTYIPLFHSIEKARLIGGKEQTFHSPFKYGMDQILTWNAYFYETFLILATIKTPISLRHFLLVINNLATSIRNNDQMLGTNYFPNFKQNVNQLRHQCLSKPNETYDHAASELLGKGLTIIQKQEGNIGLKSSSRPRIDWKKRKIFISSPTLFYKQMVGFLVFGMPERYFQACQRVTKLVRSLGLQHQLPDLRRRFSSVKILNY